MKTKILTYISNKNIARVCKCQHTLPRSVYRIQIAWPSRCVVLWLVSHHSKDRDAFISQAWTWRLRHHDMQKLKGPLPYDKAWPRFESPAQRLLHIRYQFLLHTSPSDSTAWAPSTNETSNIAARFGKNSSSSAISAWVTWNYFSSNNSVASYCIRLRRYDKLLRLCTRHSSRTKYATVTFIQLCQHMNPPMSKWRYGTCNEFETRHRLFTNERSHVINNLWYPLFTPQLIYNVHALHLCPKSLYKHAEWNTLQGK
jgi:hypothetical protein